MLIEGSAYFNEGNDPKELPEDINIVWFSFIENCFYKLRAPFKSKVYQEPI
ncbi:DUF2931 family protein [Capnocytophaga granulosa]|uniref:DUF2931 family protein n=1 Tax=Capnocytophaga granulosa TaxID=45242 RepID=UPI00361D0FA2